MKSLLTFLISLVTLQSCLGQVKTKQVLIEGQGQPIVFLHGRTVDQTAFTNHSSLLADSYTVIRMLQFNVQYADKGWTLLKTIV